MNQTPTLAILLTLATLALAGCGNPPASALETAQKACDGQTRSGLDLAQANHTVALLGTSKGCIVLELEDQKAPATVANFRTYAQDGFWDGVLFHRIIKDFMVQTGGMGLDGKFKAATHPAIKDEAASSGLKNLPYTVAMARTNAADSATDQFFINQANNAFLDASATSPGYAVFGHVVKGKEVVDAIAAVPVQEYAQGRHCQPDSQPSCPLDDVILGKVRVL